MSAEATLASVRSLRRQRIASEINVAATALLAFDYLITLHSETQLIWPSTFNAMKFLFLLNRYLPWADVILSLYHQTNRHISLSACQTTYVAAGWLVVFGIIIAEVILIIRTLAVWGNNRRIFIILVLVSFAAALGVLGIERVYNQSITFAIKPELGCVLTSGKPLIAFSFVIVIIFETFLLALTLVKGIQHYRFSDNPSIIAVLYRDGILFYLYMLAVSTINLVVVVAAPRDLANLLGTFQRVLHSCLSARVILNLREANLRASGQTSLNSTELRAIVLVPFTAEPGPGQHSSDGLAMLGP
ncbi:hypothetical protein C8Q75DRAFT_811023 [Abortiporus biennis]|nr:hypothetical protein C8Q75DRAFT_811023 [Abortiporus biennis]